VIFFNSIRNESGILDKRRYLSYTIGQNPFCSERRLFLFSVFTLDIVCPAGAGIPDPHKIFNARLDSKTARAMDVYEQDKINTSALTAVIKSGVQHNLAKAKPSRARRK
jgi:hypothetical protein